MTATEAQPYCARSAERYAQIKKMLAESHARLPELSQLTAYSTGSFARGDAHEKSDLDIFYIFDDTKMPLGDYRISKALLDAELIKIAKDLDFPEFSNDGEHIFRIYSLKEMLQKMGTPDDDYQNYFTARMLFLLESDCIFNEEIYANVRSKILDEYLRDSDDHAEDFRPIYLINDLVRFWKTLCVNYEMKRNTKEQRESKKGKHALKNLKLKYSRLLTCYSLIIPLTKNPQIKKPEIDHIVSSNFKKRLIEYMPSEDHKSVEEMYKEFHNFVSNGSAELELENKDLRNQWSSKAQEFSKKLYDIFKSQSDPDIIRYVSL